jgi:NAD(P)H-dependent FMN reductase
MSETVEIEVGSLYERLHSQFEEEVGEQYKERARSQFEEFLHNFNQEVERQREQVQNQETSE